MANYITLDNFDISKLSVDFEPRAAAKSGGAQGGGPKTFNIKYDGRPFDLKLKDKMSVPFGISPPYVPNDAKPSNPNKYSMQVRLDNTKLREFLDAIDNRIIELIAASGKATNFANIPSGSNDMIANAILAASFNPRSVNDKKPEYTPTWKVATPIKEGRFDLSIYDKHGREMNLDPTNLEVVGKSSTVAGTRNCEVSLVVRLQCIWVVSGKYGLTWRAAQIVLFPGTSTNNRTFAFGDLVEELPRDELHEPVRAHKSRKPKPSHVVEDSDSSDSESEEEEPKPTKASAASAAASSSASDSENDKVEAEESESESESEEEVKPVKVTKGKAKRTTK